MLLLFYYLKRKHFYFECVCIFPRNCILLYIFFSFLPAGRIPRYKTLALPFGWMDEVNDYAPERWRFNLPPRSWQMLQSCRVSSFNFSLPFARFAPHTYARLYTHSVDEGPRRPLHTTTRNDSVHNKPRFRHSFPSATIKKNKKSSAIFSTLISPSFSDYLFLRWRHLSPEQTSTSAL